MKMNNELRIPGFTAERVLNAAVQHKSYAGFQPAPSDKRAVLPQADRGCGFAIGLGIIGAFTGNPAFLTGGLAGIASWC